MVQNADLNDLESINILLSELGGYNDADIFLFTKLHALLTSSDNYLIVYEQHNNVIGLASAQIITELGLEKDTMLIKYLVVSNQYRDMGIGRKLEQYCCELAASRKCGRVQLHCAAKRTRAHNFYQSLGYKESPKYFSKQLD